MVVRRVNRKKKAAAEEDSSDSEDENDPNIQWSSIGKLSYLPFVWIPPGKLRSIDRVKLHWSRFTWMLLLTVCHFVTIVPLTNYNDDYTVGGATSEFLDELFPPDDKFIERVTEAEISPEFSLRMQADDVAKLMTRLQMFCMSKRGVDDHIPWSWSCGLGKVTVRDAVNPVNWDVIQNSRIFDFFAKETNESQKQLAQMCQESFFSEHILRGDDPRHIPWGDMQSFNAKTGLNLNPHFDPYTEHEAFELSKWLTKKVMHTMEAKQMTVMQKSPSAVQLNDLSLQLQKNRSSVNSSKRKKTWMGAVVPEPNETAKSAEHGMALPSSNDKVKITVNKACDDDVNRNDRRRGKTPQKIGSSGFVTSNTSSIQNADAQNASHALIRNSSSIPSDRTDDSKGGILRYNGDAMSESTLENSAKSNANPLQDMVNGPDGPYQLPLWCFEGDPMHIMGLMLREFGIHPGDGVAVDETKGKVMFMEWLGLRPNDVESVWKKLKSYKKDGTFGWPEFMHLSLEKEFVSLISKSPSRQWYVKPVCRNHHWGVVNLCQPKEMSIQILVELSSRKISREPVWDYSLRRSSLQVTATFTQMDKDDSYTSRWTPSTGWFQSYISITRRKILGGQAWVSFVGGLTALILCSLLLISEFLWTVIRLPYSFYELLVPYRKQDVTNISEALERTQRLYDGRGVRSQFLSPLQIVIEAVAVIVFFIAVGNSLYSTFDHSIPPEEGGNYPTTKCRKQYVQNYMGFHTMRFEKGLDAAERFYGADFLSSPYQVLKHCSAGMSGGINKVAVFKDIFMELFYSETDMHALAQFMFCIRCLNFISAFHGTVWIGQTLELCMSKLTWFFLVYICVVMIFACLLHVAYGIYFFQFSSFSRAVYTLVMFSVGMPDEAFDEVHMWEMNASFYVAMYLSVYAVAMVAVFMQFFVTIILDVYTQLTADDGATFQRKQAREGVMFQESLYMKWYPNMRKNPIHFREVLQRRVQSYNIGLLFKRAVASDKSLIVITGGAVRDIDYLVLCSFLQQLFHRSIEDMKSLKWPSKVIILGEANDDDELKDLVNGLGLDPPTRKRIKIKNKSPLSKLGLEKGKVAKATLVYILPSMNTEDLDGEDQFNISIALSVKGMTNTPFRLMLMRPSSKTLAMTCGILPSRCCTVNLMKTILLAQNSRVQGWSAILASVCQGINMHSKALEYAKQVQFPEEYLSSLQNRIWGFSLKDELAGKPFHEVAGVLYHECGALAFCAQIGGEIEIFPAKHILVPHTVIFCIAESDPNESAPGLVATDVNWKEHFQSERMAASIHKDSQVATLMSFTPDEARASEQDMQAMARKVKQIRQNDLFALTAMTSTGKIWQQVHSLANCFGAARLNKTKVPLKLIILVAELPPQRLVDDLRAADENSNVAFVEGNPQLQTDLVAAGANDCDVFLTFPTEAPSWDASADTNTFFLLKTLQKLKIDPIVRVVIELSSGKAGAHMLPPLHTLSDAYQDLKDFPAEPENVEEPFSLWFAASQATTPQTIIQMFANTFYCFGLLEVMQALTVNNSKMDFQPEHILLPSEFHGCEYRDFVVKCLAGAVGTGPVLPIGLLREAKWARVTLTHPAGSTKLESTDVVIVMMDQSWLDWGLSQSLICVGGVELGVRRSAENVVDT